MNEGTEAGALMGLWHRTMHTLGVELLSSFSYGIKQ
jgi:hypothetical protein